MTDARSDESLLAAVGARELDGLRTLYDRHAPWLSVRLARRCNDPEIVSDALQDTFVAVWQKPDGFRGDGDVAAWIWGIAIRRLISRLRHHRDPRPEPSANGWAPGAEEQVLLAVEYGDIGQAIGRLSPQMRAVIQAVVLDGLTTRETARLLQIPEGTVKTRLSRAKVQLRTSLAEGLG